MVDSISAAGSQISTLLRAQASTVAVNNSQQLSQTLIQQLANGAKPTTVQPAFKSAGPSEELPRGSLVDILA